MRWLVVLLGCGGCDILFQLQTVPAAHDAAITGREPLADGSAAQHDEDGDGVPDVIDNCPTVSNADQLDVGEIGNGEIADMVGDACDPHPIEMGDRIALFEPFTTLDGADYSSGVTLDASMGTIAMGGDSAVLEKAAVSNPMEVVAQLTWTGAQDSGNRALVTVASNMYRCGLEICGTNSTDTCIHADQPGASSQGIGWGHLADQLIEIRFISDNHECDLVGVQGLGQLTDTYPLAAGRVGFSTTGSTSTVTLENLIVYGR